MRIPAGTPELDAMAIAGTGRIARSLGALLHGCGVEISAVAGRHEQHARDAARFIGAVHTVPLAELPRHAHRLLIAVADDALVETSTQLAAAGMKDGVVLHTCGSVGPDALSALRETNNSVGVIHPMQTVPTPERGVETLRGATFAYAGDREASEWARSLIACLSGKALSIDPRKWQLYHAAAAIVSNYHVALVDAALELMEAAGVERDKALTAMAPLIRSTADNVLLAGPEAALTGPIRRGDVGTVRRHLKAVSDSRPEIKELYSVAGLRTVQLAEKAGLAKDSAREIMAALREG